MVSELESRRIEEMEIGNRSPKDVALENERIEELLEAARLQGMSEKGLARASKLVREKARGVWRLKLGPDDVADLPAMPVELKPDAEPLPKPYMRRYSSAEMDYWRIVIDELLAAKVIRPSDATEVSPSNLVKKKVDGVWSTSVFRPIIDLRERNKSAKDIYFALPKLDECVHMLKGAKCFAAGDKVKGYFQVLMDARAQVYGFRVSAGHL